MTLWLRRGFKQDSGKRVSLLIVLREYHLMKGPDKEASVFSRVLQWHSRTAFIIKRLWHIFEHWFLQTIWLRNDLMRLCRHFRSNVDRCYSALSLAWNRALFIIPVFILKNIIGSRVYIFMTIQNLKTSIWSPLNLRVSSVFRVDHIPSIFLRS